MEERVSQYNQEARIIQKPVILVHEEKIGQGGEHWVYRTTEENPFGEDHVVKIYSPVLGKWQTKGLQYLRTSDQALQREGVKRLPSTLAVNPTLVVRTKEGKDFTYFPDVAEISPHLIDYNDITLRWPQLKIPAIRDQVIDLGRKAERMMEQDQLGMDPLGIATLIDNMKGFLNMALKLIYKTSPLTPESIRAIIKEHLDKGIRGQMRNIAVAKRNVFLEGKSAEIYTGSKEKVQILKEDEVYLIDQGLHDLRKTLGTPTEIADAIRDQGVANVLKRIPMQQVVFPLHYIMWGAIIELLIKANPGLENQIDLPFTRDRNPIKQINRDVARKVSSALADILIPYFDQYERQQAA